MNCSIIFIIYALSIKMTLFIFCYLKGTNNLQKKVLRNKFLRVSGPKMPHCLEHIFSDGFIFQKFRRLFFSDDEYSVISQEASIFLNIFQRNKDIVKPLYSGHYRDKKVSAIERCPLQRGLSKIG